MITRKHTYLSHAEARDIRRMGAKVSVHARFTNHPLFIVDRGLRRQGRYAEKNVEGHVIYELCARDESGLRDADTAAEELPDAFDHAVLLYLLYKAQEHGSPRVELPSLAFALREMGLDPDHLQYRRRFMRALGKWQAAGCTFYSLKQPG